MWVVPHFRGAPSLTDSGTPLGHVLLGGGQGSANSAELQSDSYHGLPFLGATSWPLLNVAEWLLH